MSAREGIGTGEVRAGAGRSVEINLGWGDGTLMEQTGCKSKEMQKLEKLRHAITMLRVHGYLPQSQGNKMRDKLMRAISQAVAAQASPDRTVSMKEGE